MHLPADLHAPRRLTVAPRAGKRSCANALRIAGGMLIVGPKSSPRGREESRKLNRDAEDSRSVKRGRGINASGSGVREETE
ncbi:hypothetical protein Pta02_45250 [Planobispora takensis]|uniref:Uncharacterized protein n=1 Tax=Planobispora takensis TaxID=1367882 RepID=A0A8J3T039_9ACTN|nr:hypothetical protein Pta02_45250 [Planobispora takensis]